MRLIPPACSRLSSFALRSQTRLAISLRRTPFRRHFNSETGESSSGSPNVFEKLFHGPDEYQPVFDEVHHFFAPGEVFEFGDDQFRIERKLRHRLLSMVWLATHTNKRDPVHPDRRFVALETFDNMFSENLSVEPEHNGNLHHVRYLKVRQNEGAPGSEYCDRALRVFLGPHLCIVKEPCGLTLAELQETQPHGSFALPATKRIIKQTLLALDFLHATMQRTHVGVNVHNIQVALLGPQQVLATNMQDDLAARPPQMVYRSYWDLLRSRLGAGSPMLEEPQPLPPFGLSPSLDNLEIRLGRCEYATSDAQLEMKAARAAEADGASESESEPGTSTYDGFHAPLRLAAPEAIRGSPHPFSPPINIWAVGHLLFQCLAGREIDVYTTPVDAEGPAGPEFPHFDELSSLCEPQGLEKRLRGVAHIDEEMSYGDIQATCALLARCFAPDPAARPTARLLLQDGWFRE